MKRPAHFPAAFFYGVVSSQTERVVEFFLEREGAEAMSREVREDEPRLLSISVA